MVDFSYLPSDINSVGVPAWRFIMERFVEKLERDRRLSRRYSLKTALRVRVRRSDGGEQGAESENLSQRGVFFATDLPLSKGAALDLLVEMPEEVTGVAPAQWLCTGHVVRVVPWNSPRGANGVGVQFDFYKCRDRNGRSGPPAVGLRGPLAPQRQR